MTKIVHFYFEIFIFNFYCLKFKILSSKLYPLTLNPKFRLVSPRIKTHFYFLIKFILVIFFIETIFVTKTYKDYSKKFLNKFSHLSFSP